VNTIKISNVLGDERQAEIRPGDGEPWFNCPFCTNAVYVNDGPKELGEWAGRRSTCRNPYCVANPRMPLDRAKAIIVENEAREADRARRERDARAARERLESEAAERMERYRRIAAEARERGACERCALKLASSFRPVKFTKHRGPCPLSRP
jgi:hypothetical protein